MNRKLVITFGRLGENAFINRLDQVIAGMTGSTYVPEPWWTDPLEKPTAASLATDRTAYVAAMAAAADGDKTKIAARKALRTGIIADLQKLAKFIDLKADGDVEILESTGYELTKVRTSAGIEPLPAPQNLRIKKGGLSGTLIARCKRAKGAASYETHICSSDPSVPANWSQVAITPGCSRIEIEDLTPGTLYYVRVRAISKNGPGSWSGEESLRAD